MDFLKAESFFASTSLEDVAHCDDGPQKKTDRMSCDTMSTLKKLIENEVTTKKRVDGGLCAAAVAFLWSHETCFKICHDGEKMN